MAACIFFILFTSIILDTQAFEPKCPVVKCGHGAPDIRFPFRVKGQQPKSCGYPGFELVCKENSTIIQFPSYGDLIVNSISYELPKLNLNDPKNCVHGVFFNLNLSLSPFHYYYVVKNYTYLNCSAKLPPSFVQIPCLSGFGHHVYTVESSLAVPVSCRPVKTISIPFSYSPYISDSSFGLGFTWDLPECEVKGGQCGFQSKTGQITRFLDMPHDRGFSTKHQVIGLSIGIFVFTTLIISMMIYHSKKLDAQNNPENHLEFKILLGDYKSTKDGIL